jgi:hypothetical protein
MNSLEKALQRVENLVVSCHTCILDPSFEQEIQILKQVLVWENEDNSIFKAICNMSNDCYLKRNLIGLGITESDFFEYKKI